MNQKDYRIQLSKPYNSPYRVAQSPYKQETENQFPNARPQQQYSNISLEKQNLYNYISQNQETIQQKRFANQANSQSDYLTKLPNLTKQNSNTDIDTSYTPYLRNASQSIQKIDRYQQQNKFSKQPSQKFNNQDSLYPTKSSQNSDYFKFPQINQNIKPYSQIYKERQTPSQYIIQPEEQESIIPTIIDQYGLSTMQGMKGNGNLKTNQDSIIVEHQMSLFGVADGHGQNGEKVSAFLNSWIPKNFKKLLPVGIYTPRLIKEAFTKAFRQTNNDLWNANFDCTLAGSTLVVLWLVPLSSGVKLYCANVGDSRAVMGRKGDRGWSAIELSHDQKPSVEEEARRIIMSGGRVAHQTDSYGHPVGPLRVWMKHVQAPGLAMTRSFGDKCGAQAGVTAVPEVLEFTITKSDKFIVIASDGVWEYLESVDIISLAGMCMDSGMNSQKVSDRILQKAVESWKINSMARDDISCIVIFINQ